MSEPIEVRAREQVNSGPAARNGKALASLGGQDYTCGSVPPAESREVNTQC